MHSKTHFKFQFNSSKFSTTSVHVIFFLNTRLHYDPNKIGTTQFGFIKLEIQFLQNINQFWNNWASFWIHSHCHAGSTRQLGPHGSETETGEGLPRCSGKPFLTGVEGSVDCVTTIAIPKPNRVEGCGAQRMAPRSMDGGGHGWQRGCPMAHRPTLAMVSPSKRG